MSVHRLIQGLNRSWWHGIFHRTFTRAVFSHRFPKHEVHNPKANYRNNTKRLDAISEFLGIKAAQANAQRNESSAAASSSEHSASTASAQQGSGSLRENDGTKSETSGSAGVGLPAAADSAKSESVPPSGQDSSVAKTPQPNKSPVDPVKAETGSGKAAAASQEAFARNSKNLSSQKVSQDRPNSAPHATLAAKTPLSPLKAQEARADSAPIKSPTQAKGKVNTLKPQEAKMALPPTAPSISETMTRRPLSTQARDLLRDGIRLYSQGQYSEAESSFRRVLTVDPRNADAFYNLGSLAERNRDYVMALTNYRAALNLSPKDKDYVQAVTAMETQLSSSAPSLSVQQTPSYAQRATLGNFQVPVDAASSPQNLSGLSPTGQPFQLNGIKNDVMMTTTQYDNNSGPMVNVNQSAPPPVVGVNQRPPKGKGTLGTVVGVGMRAALYSSGLHCPICRMMGGGFHF